MMKPVIAANFPNVARSRKMSPTLNVFGGVAGASRSGSAAASATVSSLESGRRLTRATRGMRSLRTRASVARAAFVVRGICGSMRAPDGCAAMPQILVEDLEKRFRVAARDPGMWGAVRGLVHRRYRDVVALRDVSFAIEPGEIVGYIGPNGAGKSTTIKILSGILTPSGGRCTVNGLVPWRDRIAHVARIGVVFWQRTQLWWDLPVAESLELLRDIYRVDAERFVRARGELVELLDL